MKIFNIILSVVIAIFLTWIIFYFDKVEKVSDFIDNPLNVNVSDTFVLYTFKDTVTVTVIPNTFTIDSIGVISSIIDNTFIKNESITIQGENQKGILNSKGITSIFYILIFIVLIIILIISFKDSLFFANKRD
jgi:branched-subunit amino acid transport protein AzlD